MSRIFEKGEELASEETKLAFILAGENDKTLWNAKPVPYDFYDLKGIVQEIFTKLGFKNYQIKEVLRLSFIQDDRQMCLLDGN